MANNPKTATELMQSLYPGPSIGDVIKQAMSETGKAIQAHHEAHHEAQRNDRLNRSIAEFVKRYEPKDRDEAAYFNAHLHDIVRAVYADMAQPVERALTGALMNAAYPPVYVGNTAKFGTPL